MPCYPVPPKKVWERPSLEELPPVIHVLAEISLGCWTAVQYQPASSFFVPILFLRITEKYVDEHVWR